MFFFSWYRDHRDLHVLTDSFPTRRSSDLAEQILRLHTEGKVKRFFLVKDILEVLPDFPQDERVFFLEDLVASDASGTEIFKTAFSDKKTTGSWAVRFAIYLGYRDISLGGIDCSYVEVIRQAERTGVGLELRIGSEVDANPNYFLDRKNTRLNSSH